METAIQKLMFAVGRANQDKIHGAERIGYVKNLIHRAYARDMSVTENRF